MTTQPITPEVQRPPDVPVVDPWAKWREERQQFIGGSQVYHLLNQPQYGSGCARALGYEKLGVEPDFEKEIDEDLMRRGNLLEPIASAQYAAETGRKVVQAPCDEVEDPATGKKLRLPRAIRHKDYPWAGVHVDRFILAGSGGVKSTGDLEIKSRAEGPFLRVLRSGPFPGDILQVQWGNFVTGHQWGAFAMVGVFGSLPMKHYDVERDEQVIDIFKRRGDWFANHVWGKGEAPPPEIPETDDRCKICPWRLECRGELTDPAMARAMKAQKASKTELVTINNPQLVELLQRRANIKREIAVLDNDPTKNNPERGELQKVQEKIIGQCDVNALAPEKRAYYLLGYGKLTLTPNAWYGLDVARLKQEKPEIYDQYFVDGRMSGGFKITATPDKV